MASDNHEGGDTSLPDLGDAIDIVTFGQVLEMDDSEDDRSFSQGIIFDFFKQAEETFTKMDQALAAKNLDELSKLGHYLKGSSATLGLTKVKDSCEKIQRYGKKENVDGSPETDEALCLSRITDTLRTVKVEYAEAETTLRNFYNSA